MCPVFPFKSSISLNKCTSLYSLLGNRRAVLLGGNYPGGIILEPSIRAIFSLNKKTNEYIVFVHIAFSTHYKLFSMAIKMMSKEKQETVFP